ncbi:glycosyltransferase [Sulfitobacter sp. KE34]|nr:glycosyltransferase [Sulfitobacter sp. KE12]MDF3355686.1 glycosyltransferase [Sulfitobacter sp. KE27]MDF3359386.1 glycosyltransferase [Sulfitobacter sp. KE33]MDF3366818.1 glycosyltransferase [Sulfitobacter sp. Ks34]MDF3370367.1 glycosyltransferase [Sulfitobacter sp. Ks43]MDF3374018.1 glycosyltransferase [Sulfitobacter sp. KS8]MDF3377652.1 glycosyltransferase [Sulfitobacter sp. KE37]MDF3381370.1 glycosyltransferase [Sulfitobacter sp. KE32]MDF3395238.1 glycosyltransferase [Sulfitobacter sp
MKPESTLIAVFSYNMGRTLRNCLDSIYRHCPEFDVILADDQSEDVETLAIISEYQNRFVDVYTSTEDKDAKRHGNLYQNIQAMCDYGLKNGYRFLLMIQDDMQLVRPLSAEILREYSNLLAADHVLQVDPRFLRRGSEFVFFPELNAYGFGSKDYRRSYADVGVLDLAKIRKLNWTFMDSERENKAALTRLGMLRVFPFTPIMMHVPFPKAYRKGKIHKRYSLLRRGSYSFSDMTDAEISAMDSRPYSKLPYFRDLLRPKNMGISRIYYRYKSDARLFK